MAPIYSTQLYNAQHLGSFSGTAYTVPAGATVVVTDVDAWWSASAANQVLQVLLGPHCIVIRKVSVAAQQDLVQWVGKQTLNAGDTINVLATGAASNFGITGYLLMP